MLLRNLCKIRSFNNIVPIRFNRKIYTRSSSQPLCRINFEKTRFKASLRCMSDSTSSEYDRRFVVELGLALATLACVGGVFIYKGKRLNVEVIPELKYEVVMNWDRFVSEFLPLRQIKNVRVHEKENIATVHLKEETTIDNKKVSTYKVVSCERHNLELALPQEESKLGIERSHFTPITRGAVTVDGDGIE